MKINFEDRATAFAEQHGIIEYTVKGSTMVYYRKYKTDVFGHYQTAKHIVNLKDMTKQVTVLKRNRKAVYN